MNTLKTNKNNKLIAEFMGWNLTRSGAIGYYMDCYDDSICEKLPTVEELKFHESWDWLMPVVEKIQDIHGTRICIVGNGICFEKGEEYIVANTKIKAVYKFVIKYIKWYNKEVK